jgi:hypothetical protein
MVDFALYLYTYTWFLFVAHVGKYTKVANPGRNPSSNLSSGGHRHIIPNRGMPNDKPQLCVFVIGFSSLGGIMSGGTISEILGKPENPIVNHQYQ